MRNIRLAAVATWVGAVIAATPIATAGDEASPPRRAHPYMFYKRGELKTLRAKFDQPPQRYYLQALKRDADGLMERDPTEQHNAHNAFPNAVQAMVWTYLLTGEAKYRDRAMAWIEGDWDRTEYGQWSEMGTAAVAVAYDKLYHELTDAQRTKIKGYLERALAAHLKKSGGWLYNNPSNTVPAQCGAAGMAALALRWESPRAAEAVKMTVDKLKRWFARVCLSPDGGYIEGTLYWDFGGSHYLMFAHALNNTTGDDSLLNHPRLKKQHRFLETILGGNGEMMPFNDTQPGLYAMPVMADLGTRHDHALMLWTADHMAKLKAEADRGPGAPHVSSRGAFTAMAALFRGKQPGPDRFPGLPTLSHLERMEWGAMRSDGRAFVPDLVVGVKGSQGPLSHHKQNDLGSFMLYAGGEMMLLDPGYFNGDAEDHTLPLVQGKGPGHRGAEIVEAWQRGQHRAMVIDSTEAYGRIAKRVRRTVLMVGSEAVVVLDDLAPGQAAVRDDDGMPGWSPPPIGVDPQAIKATAQYQAAHKAEVDADSGAATIAGHDAALTLWTFGPELTLSVRDRRFGRSWRFRDRAEAGVYDWHTLSGRYEIQPDNPLVTVLMPGAGGERRRAPQYQRAGDTIRLALPGGFDVVFKRAGGVWRLARPQPPPEGEE